MTIDAEGKKHFENHAEISAKIWAEAGGTELECRLMALDMDAHIIRADQYAEFCSRPEAMTLLITALCEIHANAEMFGGLDSTSFKIKWKRLDKLGKHYFRGRS